MARASRPVGKTRPVSDDTAPRWLLLIHQIPPQPNYLRVKIWRRLQRLGAIAVKNTVYALPIGDQATEDFQWITQEIVKGGGDASVCEARFVNGLRDDQIEALFNEERDKDYAQIVADARQALTPSRSTKAEEDTGAIKSELVKLKRRLSEVVAVDFFGAPGRNAAQAAIAEVERRAAEAQPVAKPVGPEPLQLDQLRGRTWVTRKGIHVDRIASAWLILRFVDPEAKLKFVAGKGYQPEPREIRFDMFEAEFTHEGDRCTFEVLLDRSGLSDRALCAIGEIVHDIDLKDSKFGREETAGIAGLIIGIARSFADDESRLARGRALFDDFYAYLQRKKA